MSLINDVDLTNLESGDTAVKLLMSALRLLSFKCLVAIWLSAIFKADLYPCLFFYLFLDLPKLEEKWYGVTNTIIRLIKRDFVVSPFILSYLQLSYFLRPQL